MPARCSICLRVVYSVLGNHSTWFSKRTHHRISLWLVGCKDFFRQNVSMTVVFDAHSTILKWASYCQKKSVLSRLTINDSLAAAQLALSAPDPTLRSYKEFFNSRFPTTIWYKVRKCYSMLQKRKDDDSQWWHSLLYDQTNVSIAWTAVE